MDGALKFVKGDAIAGVAIVLVNAVGGLVALSLRGRPLAAAAERAVLLAVGDGLTSQLPALLVAVAAGVAVTRVASAEDGERLGSEVARQLFGEPRALAAVALLLGAIARRRGCRWRPSCSWPPARGRWRGEGVDGAAAARPPGGEAQAPHGRRGRRRRAAAWAARCAATTPGAVVLELAERPAGAGPRRRRRLRARAGPGAARAALARAGRGRAAAPGPRRRRSSPATGPCSSTRSRRPAAGSRSTSGSRSPRSTTWRWPGSRSGRSWSRPAGGARRWSPGATRRGPRRSGRCSAPWSGSPPPAPRRWSGTPACCWASRRRRRCSTGSRPQAPALVREVSRQVAPALLAEVLRRLLEEGVSIRPLRTILEALLEAGGGARGAAHLAAAARRALRRQIGHRAGGGDALQAVLLDPGDRAGRPRVAARRVAGARAGAGGAAARGAGAGAC